MACRCRIKQLVDNKELEDMKGLFLTLRGVKLQVDRLAELEPLNTVVPCEFMYSWGFSYYCAKPEVIEEFLKNKS